MTGGGFVEVSAEIAIVKKERTRESIKTREHKREIFFVIIYRTFLLCLLWVKFCYNIEYVGGKSVAVVFSRIFICESKKL